VQGGHDSGNVMRARPVLPWVGWSREYFTRGSLGVHSGFTRGSLGVKRFASLRYLVVGVIRRP
jgi:hypothetical protein